MCNFFLIICFFLVLVDADEIIVFMDGWIDSEGFYGKVFAARDWTPDDLRLWLTC